MESLSSEQKTRSQHVYPARDAERSAFAINDYQKSDPRSHNDQGRATSRESGLAPIGVFDSGAGGLTILSALRQELPGENYLFFGDTAHCPYGIRSEEEITELSLQACRFLIKQGAKVIVVACNTASQAALASLRATFSLPIIGVVPAVKPAARATRHGRIGIAATNQTVKAAYLNSLIEEFASDIQVSAVGCPELVTLVEHGDLAGPQVEETLLHSLHPLLIAQIDVLVLGCTHFPALRPAIERVVGPQVLVIDSGTAIARRTHAVLDTEGLLHPTSETEGQLRIWCSGDAAAFSSVASKILGYPVTASHIIL